MRARISRFLLAISAFLSAGGGALHAVAFAKARAVVGVAGFPPFYRGSFEALWLSDSATLLFLGVIFGLTAIRPAIATRTIVALIALVPAANAVCIYTFLGGFFAGHLLFAIAALTLAAAIVRPNTEALRDAVAGRVAHL